MTVLILGIDALDYNRVQDKGYLSDYDTQRLEQDLSGPNGLFTKRVWPCIFAGTSGGASDPDQERAEYESFRPDKPYMWEKYPSKVALPPIDMTQDHENMDILPNGFVESFSPEGRIEKALTGLKREIHESLDNPGIQLISATTRTLDIAGHHLPEEAEYWHQEVDKWISEVIGLLGENDKFVIISDHGFGEFGTKGIEAHTEDAVLVSNFINYDSMTEFCENWHTELDEVVRQDQMEALGYI